MIESSNLLMKNALQFKNGKLLKNQLSCMEYNQEENIQTTLDVCAHARKLCAECKKLRIRGKLHKIHYKHNLLKIVRYSFSIPCHFL